MRENHKTWRADHIFTETANGGYRRQPANGRSFERVLRQFWDGREQPQLEANESWRANHSFVTTANDGIRRQPDIGRSFEQSMAMHTDDRRTNAYLAEPGAQGTKIIVPGGEMATPLPPDGTMASENVKFIAENQKARSARSLTELNQLVAAHAQAALMMIGFNQPRVADGYRIKDDDDEVGSVTKPPGVGKA